VEDSVIPLGEGKVIRRAATSCIGARERFRSFSGGDPAA
jgi:hypothetical protein